MSECKKVEGRKRREVEEVVIVRGKKINFQQSVNDVVKRWNRQSW